MKKLLVFLPLLLLLWAIPAQAQDGYCDSNPCYLVIGPWEWVDDFVDPFWSAPSGTLEVLDYRSIPEQSIQGTTDGELAGAALFVLDAPPSETHTLPATTLDNAVLSSRLRSIERDLLGGDKLAANTQRGLVWELYTVHGDPTGVDRWKPLSTNANGELVLDLGGFSPVVFVEDGECKKGCRGSWKDTVGK